MFAEEIKVYLHHAFVYYRIRTGSSLNYTNYSLWRTSCPSAEPFSVVQCRATPRLLQLLWTSFLLLSARRTYRYVAPVDGSTGCSS